MSERQSFGDSELGQALGCGFLILVVAVSLSGCHILEEWHPFQDKTAPVAERTNSP